MERGREGLCPTLRLKSVDVGAYSTNYRTA